MSDVVTIQISEALDAYQLALLGTSETPPFVGTRDEWLASIVGPPGPEGIQGPAVDAASYNRMRDTSRFPASRNLLEPSKMTVGSAVNNAGGLTVLGGSIAASDYFPVTPGGTFISNSALTISGTLGTAFYTNEKVFISFLATTPANTAIAVPATACFARVTTPTGAMRDGFAIFDGSVLPSSLPGGLWVDRVTSHANDVAWGREMTGLQLNYFDRRNLTDGFTLTTAGATSAVANFSISNYIPVIAGEQIVLSLATGAGAGFGLVWYSLDKNIVGGTAGTLAANTPYTVPQLAAYVRFCLLTSSAVEMVVSHGSTAPTGYRDFGGGARGAHRWQGLNLGVQGDSITANPGWKTVANRVMQSRLALDYSLSGSSMGYHINRVIGSQLTSIDLHLVALGTNDWGFNRVLGVLGDAASPTASYGNYGGAGTFYGDVRGLIESLLVLKPTLRLGFMTPLPRTYVADSGGSGSGTQLVNGLGKTLRDYCNAIIQVCAQYSVPVLDLNLTSGLTSYNLAAYTLTGDGLHPTPTCAEFYGPQIGRWAESL